MISKILYDITRSSLDAGYDMWYASNEAIMAQQTDWGSIDFECENAVDPEFMFSCGEINGQPVKMKDLRPAVIEAQRAMKAGYEAAFATARSKPGAAKVYGRITALPKKSGKMQQPGGGKLDLIGLYKGALNAIGKLWQYPQAG